MPQLSSPLSTPTGMPLINSAHVAKIGGLPISFAIAADLQSAVTAERSNIAAASPIWTATQQLHVASEPGYRTWTRGTGGTDAENAAASHARRAVLPGGLVVFLAADTSALTFTTGIPAAGSGANTDVAFDSATGAYYTRTAGTWALTGYSRVNAMVASAVANFFGATGGGSGLVADTIPAPYAVAAHLRLRDSLYPSVGPLPNFFRDSTGASYQFVRDHEGIEYQTLPGECLFPGARRVRNLVPRSDDLTVTGTGGWQAQNGATCAKVWDAAAKRMVARVTAAATANSTWRLNDAIVLRAMPHRAHVRLRKDVAGSGQLLLVSAGGSIVASRTVTLDTTWKWVATPAITPPGSTAYFLAFAPATYAGTSGGTMYVDQPMIEELPGSSTVPSEYVQSGGQPVGPYWHGAAVDAVKYFAYAHGNTINDATGEVTAGNGSLATTGYGGCKYAQVGPTVRQFLSTDIVTNWTGSAMGTLTVGATAPDGTPTATKLVEDTATSSHYVAASVAGTETYGGKWAALSCYVKQDGAGGFGWFGLYAVDTAGAGKSAWFNVATGVVGTVSSGCYARIEPCGNGWWRVSLRANLGAGSNPVTVRLYNSTADNAPSHAGDPTRGVLVWCPNLTSANSATGSERALPVYAALNAGTASVQIPGAHIGLPVRGLIGATDFAVTSRWCVYGDIGAEGKLNGEGLDYLAAYMIRSADAGFRTGFTRRPAQQVTNPALDSHYMECAADWYALAGNGVDYAKWQPNTRVEAGQFVVPTDTEPNNANNRNMYVCVVAGTTGATEPTWNTAFVAPPDTTTNVTTSGTAVFQNNLDNGISGRMEVPLVRNLRPAAGFWRVYGCAQSSRADAFGAWLDGTAMESVTDKQFAQGLRPVYAVPLDYMWLGSLGQQTGAPNYALQAGTNLTGSMGAVGWQGVGDIVIYHTSPTDDVLQASTL